MYDYIVVGAGFSGSVIARELAEKDKHVLVLEKRPHIAGNMYDKFDDNGVLIQIYGPHTFVTNDENIIKYISKYGEWVDYYIEARVEIDGKLMPIPFNFKTIELFYSESDAKKLIDKLKINFKGLDRVPVYELVENQDEDISNFGKLLLEKDYYPYTSKQWGIPYEKIDKSVIGRVKFALSYDQIYMQQKYQKMPITSFTDYFKKVLNHENITVKTNFDANTILNVNFDKKQIENTITDKKIPIIYTGPIDELFDYKFGKLPYRSLDIQFKTYDANHHQQFAIITYPQAEGYTRISEYKYFTKQNIDKTTISVEYPVEYDPNADVGNVPYYPIINDDNMRIYKKYKDLSEIFTNLYVCGRLGDYKYYNMDAAISRALELSEKIINETVQS